MGAHVSMNKYRGGSSVHAETSPSSRCICMEAAIQPGTELLFQVNQENIPV